MMNSKINTLITGAGGAGSLGREIMKSLFYVKKKYEIFVTNSSALSLGLFETKNSFVIPNACTLSLGPFNNKGINEYFINQIYNFSYL